MKPTLQSKNESWRNFQQINSVVLYIGIAALLWGSTAYNVILQRWSRGHRTRGQGQGHKKYLRPRPKTTLPRTDLLEAKTKDTGASVLQKTIFFSGDFKNKSLQKKLLLVLELHSRGFYVQAYADDLTVFITGAEMLWIWGMAQNWASEQELQFSSKKTKIVLFTHKRNLSSLSMNGSKLELSKEARL